MKKWKIRVWLYDGFCDTLIRKIYTDKGEAQWDAIALNVNKNKPEGFVKAEVIEITPEDT